MINFNEDLHKYTTNGGREYISVTTLIGEYYDEFETNRIAIECEERGKEREDYKYAGMSAKEIKNQWTEICTEALRKGNKYHNLKELEILYSGQVLQHPLLDGKTLLYPGYQEYVDLYKLEGGIKYPELRVYWDELELAGHVDYVEVDFGGVVHIKDYKTNRKPLSKKGYKGKMMNAPLGNLPDSSYFHYALQLNLYAWILEQYGYTIGSLEVLHKKFLDDEPIPEEFRIPFVSEKKQRETVRVPIPHNRRIIELLIDDRRNKKT